MIYAEIKSAAFRHMVTGLILSAAILSVILLSKYGGVLSDTVIKLDVIRINISRMNQSLAEMDAIKAKINSLLPPDYYSASSTVLLMTSLDNIKTAIKGCQITLPAVEQKTGSASLPVNISFPVYEYSSAVKGIGYLQSMKFPFFELKSIDIDKTGDREGVIICKIEGLLKMPSDKLKKGEQ